jgi:hypothetical protein
MKIPEPEGVLPAFLGKLDVLRSALHLGGSQPKRHAEYVRASVAHIAIALDGPRERLGHRVIRDVTTAARIHINGPPHHAARSAPDRIEVVPFSTHPSTVQSDPRPRR